MPIIIVDANIMASALMGRSLPLLAEIASRVPVVAPLAQIAETRRVLIKREQADVSDRMADLLRIVEPLQPETFFAWESKARARLHERGQPDWPLLAAAMALGGEIWSRDPDLFGSGIAVWSTRNINFVEADEPPVPTTSAETDPHA